MSTLLTKKIMVMWQLMRDISRNCDAIKPPEISRYILLLFSIMRGGTFTFLFLMIFAKYKGEQHTKDVKKSANNANLTAIPYRESTGFLQGSPCVVILHLHALAVYRV